MEKKKNITIYDIAKEAGISASMVSRVLSGKGSVAPKTRERIQSIIDKYDFKPNEMARGLQKSRTRIIGYMIPSVGHEYFSSVYYEFEKHASENGYMTVLYNGKNDLDTEHRILNVFEEIRVEAAIIMGGGVDALSIDPGYARAIETLGRKVPCILCSEQADKFGCMGVHMDSRKAAELVVDHLLKKNYGTLAILGGAQDIFPSVYIREHMKDYAAKKGVEIRPEWIHGVSYDAKDGKAAMKKLLEQKELPRAVFCINDYVACGAMEAALEAGVKIPEEMAIIGNDNLEIADIVRPHLTSVGKSYQEMGEILFQMMQEGLEGKEAAQKLITPFLVEREST